jgi:hypothetical protein
MVCTNCVRLRVRGKFVQPFGRRLVERFRYHAATMRQDIRIDCSSVRECSCVARCDGEHSSAREVASLDRCAVAMACDVYREGFDATLVQCPQYLDLSLVARCRIGYGHDVSA